MDTSMGETRAESGAKSPPTARVMDVLAALANSPNGLTSAELAKSCAISTSTCALVLADHVLRQRAISLIASLTTRKRLQPRDSEAWKRTKSR